MNILLVDDDAAVLQVLLATLQQNPTLKVAAAGDAASALAAAATLGTVDLLVTDVVMEPTDGFSLRNQLQEQHPACKVVFISGYDLSDYGAYTVGCDVLTKPFDGQVLLNTVLKYAPVAVPVAVPVAPVAVARAVAVPVAAPVAVAQPVAVPVAAPVAVAQPVAVPVVAPVAVAQPVAVPVVAPVAVAKPAAPVAAPVAVAKPAAPVAAPVAVAKPAAPVAAPVAVAKPAAPVAAPVAVAKPAAPAAPVAVAKPAAPVAAPVAVAKPAAPAAPVAVAKPAAPVAAPVAVAKPAAPVAAPVAAKPAAPVAAPVAAAVAVAKPAAAAAVPAAALPDGAGSMSGDLAGKRVGAYHIVSKTGSDEWGPLYRAVQTSMNRPVEVSILSEQVKAVSPAAQENFIANARAKASVKHPTILSVYEAGETSGHTFYAFERIDGVSVAEAKNQGIVLDDTAAIRLIRGIVEGMGYLHLQKIAHSALTPDTVFLSRDGTPRLANIAGAGADKQESQGDIAALSTMVAALLPGGKSSDLKLQELLQKMLLTGASGFLSWSVLLQVVKGLERSAVPVDAIKLTAQEHAAIRAVEDAKKQQKKQLVYTTVGAFAALWVIGFLVYFKFIYTGERDFSEMVKVPAGAFIYQNGEKATTGEFWIDKYEVTMGQYGRFLEALEANPTDKYDHPDQPKGKAHYPRDKQNWTTYYGRARKGLDAAYTPINLNCPVFNVDYWDAYAYAKWAGKRLPTEQEWEKAARGEKGNKFPWGNEYDEKKLNGQNDYIARPGPASKGIIDGYFKWAPVDAFLEDKSPYGVIGMAGNVAEWTTAANGKPVIRGGYFYKNPETPNSDKPREMTVRFDKLVPEDFQEYIGFRCVSDKKL